MEVLAVVLSILFVVTVAGIYFSFWYEPTWTDSETSSHSNESGSDSNVQTGKSNRSKTLDENLLDAMFGEQDESPRDLSPKGSNTSSSSSPPATTPPSSSSTPSRSETPDSDSVPPKRLKQKLKTVFDTLEEIESRQSEILELQDEMEETRREQLDEINRRISKLENALDKINVSSSNGSHSHSSSSNGSPSGTHGTESSSSDASSSTSGSSSRTERMRSNPVKTIEKTQAKNEQKNEQNDEPEGDLDPMNGLGIKQLNIESSDLSHDTKKALGDFALDDMIELYFFVSNQEDELRNHELIGDSEVREIEGLLSKHGLNVS